MSMTTVAMMKASAVVLDIGKFDKDCGFDISDIFVIALSSGCLASA